MQIKNSSKMYRSMFDCAKYVHRTEGLGAFYVSYPTTLSMTVPFAALQFLAYESISTAMNPSKTYDPYTHCIAGAVAGGFASGLTTPMDVIKTMLQTRGSATDPELRTVSGFRAGCKLLYRREGFRGFFKGIRPRILTTMPSTAICWSAYEFSKCVSHSHSHAPLLSFALALFTPGLGILDDPWLANINITNTEPTSFVKMTPYEETINVSQNAPCAVRPAAYVEKRSDLGPEAPGTLSAATGAASPLGCCDARPLRPA